MWMGRDSNQNKKASSIWFFLAGLFVVASWRLAETSIRNASVGGRRLVRLKAFWVGKIFRVRESLAAVGLRACKRWKSASEPSASNSVAQRERERERRTTKERKKESQTDKKMGSNLINRLSIRIRWESKNGRLSILFCCLCQPVRARARETESDGRITTNQLAFYFLLNMANFFGRPKSPRHPLPLLTPSPHNTKWTPPNDAYCRIARAIRQIEEGTEKIIRFYYDISPHRNKTRNKKTSPFQTYYDHHTHTHTHRQKREKRITSPKKGNKFR